jgi:hypothetical protein
MASKSVNLIRPLLSHVRAEGWVKAQLQRDLDWGFAGVLDVLTDRISNDLFTDRIASWVPNLNGAGMHVADGDESRPYDLEGEPDVHWWDAETRGNWVWGSLMMAHLSEEPRHISEANSRALRLRDTQDSDGYLGAYRPESRFSRPDIENGELWAQSRALLIVLSHYELTGDESSLDAATRSADLTLRVFGPGRPYFHTPQPRHDVTGMTHGLNYADATQRLHELTGEERYREFAVWLYEDFSTQSIPFQNDDMARPNAGDPTRPLSGHAAHTAEHVRPLLLACRDDGSLIASALRKLRLFSVPSGALVGDESVHGVPMPDSGYEVCTMTEQLWSLCEALRVTGDAALGDWAERLFFNALQGSRSPDGRDVSYLTADTRLSARIERPDVYALIQDGVGRYKVSPTHEDIATCCVANATRVVPHYLSYAWLKATDGVIIAALHGPSSFTADVDGIPVTIHARTDYPFEDRLRYVVEAPSPVHFSLRIRRPGWASVFATDAADLAEDGAWFVVERRWTPGDTVVIDLVAAVVAIPYANGEVAVQRGPLQFVQPIAHEERSLKTYARAGFRDAELIPVDDAAISTYPVLPHIVDLGLTLVREDTADLSRPWDSTPLRLEGSAGLVPLGCTRLRRAAFTLGHADAG